MIPPKILTSRAIIGMVVCEGPIFPWNMVKLTQKNNLEHSSHGIAEPPPHFEVRLKSCLFDIRLPSN